MALTGDTGNGATLTLALFNGTTAITAALDVMNINPGRLSVDSVDVSTLGTTGIEERIPGDIAKHSELTADFKFITKEVKPTLPSAAGTGTITYPLRSSETTAATKTGTGFLTGFEEPTLANGQLQVGKLSWQWDGDTGPAFTAAS